MNILFDLDGVLVDFAELHRNAFIQAWNSVHPTNPLDEMFHAKHLEARSTRQKLAILSTLFEGQEIKANEVSALKQEITQEKLKTAHVYTKTREALAFLKARGARICVCSNSIRATVEASLQKLAPLTSFDLILSNEDVIEPKPNPEIYLKAIATLGVDPKDVLVFEDSTVKNRSPGRRPSSC